ncbi:MAG: hypothetical protein K8U57_13205, partial [Planctomycetes bacterium]|nr:hypothetical protein [Planctomycetota bacterium]
QPAPAGEPTIKLSTAGGVDSNLNDIGKGANRTGSVYAPPGFDDAKRKFAEELRKLQQKK